MKGHRYRITVEHLLSEVASKHRKAPLFAPLQESLGLGGSRELAHDPM